MKLGSKLTKEQRENISIATKKAMSNFDLRKKLSELKKGKTTWMKGKKHTQESKKKLSQSLKGRKYSKETILKFKNRIPWNKGKILSPMKISTRLKISHSHKIKVLNGTHPSYKGGLTEINQIIKSSVEYKLWREAVFKRDDFICQECGDKKGGNLEAHHIKPQSLFPELRLAIDNGLTLCKLCHKKTNSWGHKIKDLLIINLKENG